MLYFVLINTLFKAHASSQMFLNLRRIKSDAGVTVFHLLAYRGYPGSDHTELQELSVWWHVRTSCLVICQRCKSTWMLLFERRNSVDVKWFTDYLLVLITFKDAQRKRRSLNSPLEFKRCFCVRIGAQPKSLRAEMSHCRRTSGASRDNHASLTVDPLQAQTKTKQSGCFSLDAVCFSLPPAVNAQLFIVPPFQLTPPQIIVLPRCDVLFAQ